MQGWLIAAGVIAVAYLTTAAFLWVKQESLLFFPRPLEPAIAEQLRAHEVKTSQPDGTQLAGWSLPGPAGSSKPVVVYFGGNAEEISYSIQEISQKLNLPAAGMNYRGYGNSEGKPTGDNLRRDAVAAFDALLAASGVVEGEAIVLGRSLGSHMAAVVAARRDVAGLVLVTPFDSISAVASRRYPIFPVQQMLRHEMDTVAETSRIRAPAIIIGASDDRVVPVDHANELFKTWLGQAEITNHELKDADHNNITYHPDYWESISAFITRTWPKQQ